MAEEKKLLSNLPWYYQFLILMGLVTAVIFAADYFMIADTRAESAKNFERLEQLKRENDANQIVLGNMKAFEQALTDSNGELEQLRDLLPEEVQLSTIMQAIQTKARARHLTLRVFRPLAPVAREYYTEKPIAIDVTGSYDDLGRFLADLANYERINNVSNFEVMQTELQTEKVSVSSTFTLTVYYVTPENLANLQNKEKAAKDDKKKGNEKK